MICTNHSFTLVRYRQLPYRAAMERQLSLTREIAAGRAGDHLLLLEHPAVYTIGRSGTRDEVLDTETVSGPIPVIDSDRGGRVTYHGPGQLIAYVIRNLGGPARGVRDHVGRLEETVIHTLAAWGLRARRETGNPGVWVNGEKIAALGVRIRGGVAYHGIAINRDPDLSRFRGIVPCGLPDRPVTSLVRLGVRVSRAELEEKFLVAFQRVFNVQWRDPIGVNPSE